MSVWFVGKNYIAEQRKEKTAFIYCFAQHERGRETFRSDENSTNHATSRLHGRHSITKRSSVTQIHNHKRRPKEKEKSQQNKSNFKLEVFGVSRSEREKKVDDLSRGN